MGRPTKQRLKMLMKLKLARQRRDELRAARRAALALETQALKKQALETQALKKQALERQALKKQALERQALKKQALETQALKKQALETQALKKPALGRQALQKPALETQALKKQALETQALKKQALETQALKKQALETQALKKQTLETQALKKQALETQALKKQALETQALKKQALETKALKRQALEREPMERQALKRQALEIQASETKARSQPSSLPLAAPPQPAASTTPTENLKTSSAEERKRLTHAGRGEGERAEEPMFCAKKVSQNTEGLAICGRCQQRAVTFSLTHREADVSITFKCSECGHVVYDSSEVDKSLIGVNMNPLTMSTVYLAMFVGRGYTAAKRFCDMLGLRHLTNVTYERYAKFITERTVENSRAVLRTSRDIVVKFYTEKFDRDLDSTGILDIDVTFDLWRHVSGTMSNYGVGAVIDVYTRLVLDYEVLCRECHVCIAKIMEKKKWKEWKADDSHSCDVNYSGGALAMSPEAARRIWNRSLENKLRYVHFISDGDISGFLAIKELNNGGGPYGKAHPVKCIVRDITRNPNKFFHKTMWQYCPRRRKTTKREVEFAAATAATKCNARHVTSNLNALLGIPPTAALEDYLREGNGQLSLPLKEMGDKQLQQQLSHAAGSC